VSTNPETVQEILARYVEAYDKREKTIGSFLDDNGDLLKGATFEAYDDACYTAWGDSHGDLGSLIGELKEALDRTANPAA
jgi:hypothetical protein